MHQQTFLDYDEGPCPRLLNVHSTSLWAIFLELSLRREPTALRLSGTVFCEAADALKPAGSLQREVVVSELGRQVKSRGGDNLGAESFHSGGELPAL